ncbi:uncharacterized protein [Porites lutea]|uniref:uncharacterized protein n=1 Tax=Porites lutea TaxID=51062 RepID=UPI003CC55B2A
MYKKLLVCLLISALLLLDQVKSSNAVPWGRRDFAEWNLLKRGTTGGNEEHTKLQEYGREAFFGDKREPGGGRTETYKPPQYVGREVNQGKRGTTGGNEEHTKLQEYGREAFLGDKREPGGGRTETYKPPQYVGREVNQRKI